MAIRADAVKVDLQRPAPSAVSRNRWVADTAKIPKIDSGFLYSEARAGKEIQGQEIDVFRGPPPGTLAVDGHATGVATHLGRFTVTWNLTVNLADGSATGSFHFIAANGDSIFTTISGQGEPTDTPGLARIVEINTIVVRSDLR